MRLGPVRLSIALTLSLLSACKSQYQPTEAELRLFSGPGRSYSIKKPITICFMQTSASSGWEDVDALNEAFKKAIEDEWGAKTGVITAGWKPCAEMPAAMVKLNFFDCPDNSPQCPDGNSRPHVAYIGPPIAGPNQVNLRRTYEGHWRSKDCNGRRGFLGIGRKSELDARIECTRNYGLHEFGHILGFSHEHTHYAAPSPACGNDQEEHYKEAGEGSALWTCGSGYDEDSVMNYCATKGWFNWNLGLSSKDVSCAKEFFARQNP